MMALPCGMIYHMPQRSEKYRAGKLFVLTLGSIVLIIKEENHKMLVLFCFVQDCYSLKENQVTTGEVEI